ncbi:MAG: hypothetical protein PHF30_01610 [Bacilli bacterium]|nr:hypothetical protein [Bacilli bacterium]
MKKNIVFIGYPLRVDLSCKYENRIALWKGPYDKLNLYKKVVDLGNILLKLNRNEKSKILELELCNRIMNLIDHNTIAIIDTAYAAHGLFEDYEELYNQLKKHLEKINNTEVKFFLCQPLKFMGRRRLNYVLKEYVKLEEIFGLRVYLFIDNNFVERSNLLEHEKAFIDYVYR